MSILAWAFVFLILAIIAALFDFKGVAGTATWIAKALFVVFLILLVIALITNYMPAPLI